MRAVLSYLGIIDSRNRLNNHESAISNISIFKLFAMFVPPLFIIIVIIIICFIFKTKK